MAAKDKRVRDVIRPGLEVLFCGINPGLYSAAVGHHFARPGNRFWPTLHAAGFTPRLMRPEEEAKLLELGLGITNIVARTTARADELAADEIQTGARLLKNKVKRLAPRLLAVVGLGAYRAAFADPTARCGLQPSMIGTTKLWLLPNPSGLNAHHQPSELARLFRELYEFSRATK